MKQQRSKTYIELHLTAEEEGGGFGLIVESGSVKESERLFNRLLKKLQTAHPGARLVKSGSSGLYQ